MPCMVVLLWRRVIVVSIGWLGIHVVSCVGVTMMARVMLGLVAMHRSHSMHMHVTVRVHMGVGIGHVMMLPLVFLVFIINVIFDRMHAVVLVGFSFVILLFLG